MRSSRLDFVKEKLIERLIGREDYENFDKRPRYGILGVTGNNATRSQKQLARVQEQIEQGSRNFVASLDTLSSAEIFKSLNKLEMKKQEQKGYLEFYKQKAGVKQDLSMNTTLVSNEKDEQMIV